MLWDWCVVGEGHLVAVVTGQWGTLVLLAVEKHALALHAVQRRRLWCGHAVGLKGSRPQESLGLRVLCQPSRWCRQRVAGVLVVVGVVVGG